MSLEVLEVPRKKRVPTSSPNALQSQSHKNDMKKQDVRPSPTSRDSASTAVGRRRVDSLFRVMTIDCEMEEEDEKKYKQETSEMMEDDNEEKEEIEDDLDYGYGERGRSLSTSLSPTRDGQGQIRGAKWSSEEDDKLQEIVKELGAKNWKKIAELHGHNRIDVQCQHRWNKVLKPGLTKGLWTPQEDDILKAAVEEVEEVGMIPKWNNIAQRLPGRIGKQCRERWMNHIDPKINKSEWTEKDDEILHAAHTIYGNKWKEIAIICGKRSENAVKNRFNSAAWKKWVANNSSRLQSNGEVEKIKISLENRVRSESEISVTPPRTPPRAKSPTRPPDSPDSDNGKKKAFGESWRPPMIDTSVKTSGYVFDKNLKISGYGIHYCNDNNPKSNIILGPSAAGEVVSCSENEVHDKVPLQRGESKSNQENKKIPASYVSPETSSYASSTLQSHQIETNVESIIQELDPKSKLLLLNYIHEIKSGATASKTRIDSNRIINSLMASPVSGSHHVPFTPSTYRFLTEAFSSNDDTPCTSSEGSRDNVENRIGSDFLQIRGPGEDIDIGTGNIVMIDASTVDQIQIDYQADLEDLKRLVWTPLATPSNANRGHYVVASPRFSDSTSSYSKVYRHQQPDEENLFPRSDSLSSLTTMLSEHEPSRNIKYFNRRNSNSSKADESFDENPSQLYDFIDSLESRVNSPSNKVQLHANVSNQRRDSIPLNSYIKCDSFTNSDLDLLT